MNDMNRATLIFASWASQTYATKKDVLELMLISDSALDRIIAPDIIRTAIAGGGE